jgi:hypothetical protein
MKKILFSGFLFVPLILAAQQWRPFTSTEKFNFRIDTATCLSNVIQSDSIMIQGSDSVFYLNRIVTTCKGCIDPYTRLYNQPQFLEREMIRKGSGIYHFQDPGSFWLHTLASVNSSWVFDSAANITAQVTSKTWEQILTQWDSVKTITLSNGNLIRTSKNHGIIQFPLIGTSHYYLLEGIAGRNLGILLPGFMDFYNFNVGDVFQYRYKSLNYGITEGYEGLTKITITSRDSSSNEYIYGTSISDLQWQVDIIGFQWDSILNIYTNTEILQNSPDTFTNQNPHALVSNVFPDFSNMVSVMSILMDTGQFISRVLGGPMNYPVGGLYQYGSGDTLLPDGYYDQKYTVSLGRVDYHYLEFEIEEFETMIGYVKNGDTTGIVYPDQYWPLGTSGMANHNALTIYPNPANDKITIQTSKETSGSRLTILNIDGQQFLNRQLTEPKTQIDISDLPSGVYFVRVTSERTVEVGKINKE